MIADTSDCSHGEDAGVVCVSGPVPGKWYTSVMGYVLLDLCNVTPGQSRVLYVTYGVLVHASWFQCLYILPSMYFAQYLL